MRKIKKNDNVIVITGKEKGKQGKVIKVLDGKRVIIEGINTAKKHQKPNPAKGITGGIIEKTIPVDISNVAVFNPRKNAKDKVGYKILNNGKKVRIFKADNEVIEL